MEIAWTRYRKESPVHIVFCDTEKRKI